MASNPRQNPLNEVDMAYRKGRNFVCETMDIRQTTSTVAFSASGRLSLAIAPIVEGDVISNLSSYSTVAGTGVSLFKLAVYDRGLNLVASTVDLTAQLGAGAWQTSTVTPWQSSYSGIVYMGAFCVFATTTPSLVGNATTAGASVPFSGVLPHALFQTGLADIPATTTGSIAATLPYILAT